MPLRFRWRGIFTFGDYQHREVSHPRISLVTLRAPRQTCAVTPVRLLLLLFLACSSSGCAFFYAHNPTKVYYCIRVSDIEDHLVSQWIAEGYVARTEHGYKFTAVERYSAGPFPQHLRYPYGRAMEIGGQNIIVSRCGKPLWLYSLEYK